MAHPARLSLRAPPHLPFVQGFPGIPPSDPSSPGPPRLQPAVHGTVELRVGNTPVKAKWVRVEIRKHEILPPGFPSSSTTPATIWDHVGEIVTLWQPPAGKDYDTLETADFKFLLPLPANLPPSVEMLKETGVRYELVAALCYRQKGGLFKKEATPIMKVSEPLRIVKHDLHSAWPIYNQPDAKSQQALGGVLTLTVQRPSTAFGPTDRILFTASLKSMQAKPFKLKGFECSIHEVITVFPTQTSTSTNKRKSKLPPQPTVRSRVIASTRAAVDESVGRGGEKSVRVDMGVPSDKLLMTVKQAKMMAVGYELEVKTVSEGAPEVACSGIQYTVGPYARTHAQQAVKWVKTASQVAILIAGISAFTRLYAQDSQHPHSLPSHYLVLRLPHPLHQSRSRTVTPLLHPHFPISQMPSRSDSPSRDSSLKIHGESHRRPPSLLQRPQPMTFRPVECRMGARIPPCPLSVWPFPTRHRAVWSGGLPLPTALQIRARKSHSATLKATSGTVAISDTAAEPMPLLECGITACKGH